MNLRADFKDNNICFGHKLVKQLFDSDFVYSNNSLSFSFRKCEQQCSSHNIS